MGSVLALLHLPNFGLSFEHANGAEAACLDRNAATVLTYATDAYSYRRIAEHFSVHLATVGRIAHKTMQRFDN